MAVERLQFCFTPTHASWLNHIELCCSTLARSVLSLGHFAGLDELAEKVHRLIDYYNQNQAQSYRWI